MRPRDWASAIFGGAAVAAAVFAGGGAFRWAQALVAALAALAVASQIPSRRRLGLTSPLVLVLAVAILLTAISLLPLPHAIRELIDPVGTAYRDDGTSLLDVIAWPGLTRDAPSSLRALIFFLVLLGVALVTLRLGASERGRYRVLSFITFLCGLAGVVTVLHELVGAKRLYGIYEMHAKPSILGPLLNENHLGCLMAIGTCAAAGLVMYPRQSSRWRAMWMVIVLLCGALTAASHSRGAILSLIVGALVVSAALLGQRFTSRDHRTKRSRLATNSIPIGVVGICVVVLVVYSNAGRVNAELGRTNLEELTKPHSKFAAWRSSEALIRESPWVGVGRGGFETSFTRIHPASGSVTFAFLENEYIQAVVDWGIVGGALLAMAMLWFAGVAVRRWRDGPLAAGALGALTVVAVQSNVDFGVELLGLALPVTVIACTLSYVPVREIEGRPLAFTRGLRVALFAALLVGVFLLRSSHTTSITEDHERLRESSTTMDDVRAAAERHPMDYYGYAVGADITAHSNDSRSIALLNHALRLHPTHPDLHRIAAHLLQRGGRMDQAAIEFAVAMRYTTEPERVLGEILSTFSPKLAAAAIPADYPALDRMVAALRLKHREDVAALWLPRVLELRPHDVQACNLLYDLSLGLQDLTTAEIAGRNCLELMPDHQTRHALAKLLVQKHAYTEAIRLLQDVENWGGLAEEKTEAWLMLCDARIASQRWDDASVCLHRLDASGNVAPDKRTEITKRLEEIQKGRALKDLSSGSATQ